MTNNFNNLHASFKINASVVTCALVVEYDANQNSKDLYHTFYDVIEKRIFRNKEEMPKLFSSLNKYCGYGFLKRTEMNTQECIKRINFVMEDKREINKEDLLNYLIENYHKPLPRNNEILWDIHVCENSIKWNKNNSKFYPIIIRFHHVIGDGINLQKFLFTTLADKNDQVFKSFSTFKVTSGFWRKFVKVLYLMALFSWKVFCIFVIKGKDKHILCGKPHSGKETLVINFDIEGEYFKKLKCVKKKLSNAYFSETLLTVLSASLSDYFKENSPNKVEFISVILPTISKQNISIPLEGVVMENITLTNNYAMNSLLLPIHIENFEKFDKKASLTSRLKLIQRQINAIKSERAVYYILTQFITGVFPLWLARATSSIFTYTSAFSFLPPIPQVTFADGAIVGTSLCFWVPRFTLFSVNISSMTYDNKLIIAMNVDDAYFDRKTAQKIIDDVYKYIDKFSIEIGV
ncbi:hypothetical protein FQA39_LY05775 [Lamprigera yunnana]|nr:hypothetical protein FQA39_LY05775 [Lamprigera yunnana]